MYPSTDIDLFSPNKYATPMKHLIINSKVKKASEGDLIWQSKI
jgi:hypothetical protein